MSERPADRTVLEVTERRTSEVVALARRICEIPAPTSHEAERAAFARDHFAAQGIETWIDDVGNACGKIPGTDPDRNLLFVAHTDTVFPAGTDLTTRSVGEQVFGPGIGDNSLSVAALLTLPTLLAEAGVRPTSNLLLCANVGEEGLGNLRGIRRLVDEYRDTLEVVIAIEGHGLGRVTNGAVGSKRLRITVTGPGGHSWGAFGNPSAIHTLASIITAIDALSVPTKPKTTYNVGQIEGGTSINTIAPTASLLLDLRSIDPAALEDLTRRVAAIVDAAHRGTQGITVRSELLGDRPAGAVAPDAPIVRAAQAVLRRLQLEPILMSSSTDANIPIAEGIPAVCVGLTVGGNSHRIDEFIDVRQIPLGLAQLVLLVADLGGPTM